MCIYSQGYSIMYINKLGIISFSWTANDSKLISGSWDGTARLWDVSNNICIQTFSGHENGVHVLGLMNSLIATTSTGEAVSGNTIIVMIKHTNIREAS